MVKLSLEELKNKYSDRYEPKAMESAPVVEQVTTPLESSVVTKKSGNPFFTFLMLAGGVMVIGFIILAMGNGQLSDKSQKSVVLGETVQSVSEDENIISSSPIQFEEDAEELPDYVGAEVEEPIEDFPEVEEVAPEEEVVIVRILPNELGGVNLRESPGGSARYNAKSDQEFEYVSEVEGWIEIQFDSETTYWVSSDLVEKL